MRRSIILLILLLATKGHMSQVVGQQQSLESLANSSSHIVVARPLPADSIVKVPTKAGTLRASHRILEVLSRDSKLKAGDPILVGPAHESLFRAIGEAQAAGGPVPSPILPTYSPARVPTGSEPSILFLVGPTEADGRKFNLQCSHSVESLDSLEAVRSYLGIASPARKSP